MEEFELRTRSDENLFNEGSAAQAYVLTKSQLQLLSLHSIIHCFSVGCYSPTLHSVCLMCTVHDPIQSNVDTLSFQARYKESREARKKLLTPGHKYIFEILADRLSLELQAVEEFVLDAPSVSRTVIDMNPNKLLRFPMNCCCLVKFFNLYLLDEQQISEISCRHSVSPHSWHHLMIFLPKEEVKPSHLSTKRQKSQEQVNEGWLPLYFFIT